MTRDLRGFWNKEMVFSFPKKPKLKRYRVKRSRKSFGPYEVGYTVPDGKGSYTVTRYVEGFGERSGLGGLSGLTLSDTLA